MAENEERQLVSTAAAETGEAQQFTLAAENEERQQEPRSAAEIGEAQQFTLAAENEERQQESTTAVEVGEAQQGREHNQLMGSRMNLAEIYSTRYLRFV